MEKVSSPYFLYLSFSMRKGFFVKTVLFTWKNQVNSLAVLLSKLFGDYGEVKLEKSLRMWEMSIKLRPIF
jgi:hypothetical protein